MAERSEGHANGQMHKSTLPVGCSGDCEYGQPCNCSHSAWRAPRQPRKPAPKPLPRLSLWRRLGLFITWLRACFGSRHG